MRVRRGLLLMLASVALAIRSTPAVAAMVSGTLVSSDGQPVVGYQVHFENQVSGDSILAETGKGGSFKASLPPGVYDLREEHGARIARSIVVGEADVTLGGRAQRHPASLIRVLQLEGVGQAVIDTPAAATANVPVRGAVMVGSAAAADMQIGQAKTTPATVAPVAAAAVYVARRRVRPSYAIEPDRTDTSQPWGR